jgi:hypothetical protein
MKEAALHGQIGPEHDLRPADGAHKRAAEDGSPTASPLQANRATARPTSTGADPEGQSDLPVVGGSRERALARAAGSRVVAGPSGARSTKATPRCAPALSAGPVYARNTPAPGATLGGRKIPSSSAMQARRAGRKPSQWCSTSRAPPRAPLRRNAWIVRVTPLVVISRSSNAESLRETPAFLLAKVDVECSNPFSRSS